MVIQNNGLMACVYVWGKFYLSNTCTKVFISTVTEVKSLVDNKGTAASDGMYV